MSVRTIQRLFGLVEEHTRRQIQATRLIQPKMPESDWPISDVVVTAERIAMTDAAMVNLLGLKLDFPRGGRSSRTIKKTGMMRRQSATLRSRGERTFLF